MRAADERASTRERLISLAFSSVGALVEQTCVPGSRDLRPVFIGVFESVGQCPNQGPDTRVTDFPSVFESLDDA